MNSRKLKWGHMSWDVILIDMPSGIVTIDDLPKDFSPELGPRTHVLSTIATMLPDLDLTDPAWGILDGDDFSIEFNIGDGDPITDIMLHVRGGDDAIHVIQHICEHTGWRAFDTSTGDLIDFAQDPTAGLRQWRAYRDRVVASLKAEGKKVITDAKVGRLRTDVIKLARPKKKDGGNKDTDESQRT
jgi:hypothetical protein